MDQKVSHSMIQCSPVMQIGYWLEKIAREARYFCCHLWWYFSYFPSGGFGYVSSSQPSLSSFTELIPLTSVSGEQDLAQDVLSKKKKLFTLLFSLFWESSSHRMQAFAGSLCLGTAPHRGWRTELQSASLGSRRDKIVSIKIYFYISLHSVTINKMENHCRSSPAFSLYQSLSFLPWQQKTSKRENKLNYSLVHGKKKNKKPFSPEFPLELSGCNRETNLVIPLLRCAGAWSSCWSPGQAACTGRHQSLCKGCREPWEHAANSPGCYRFPQPPIH